MADDGLLRLEYIPLSQAALWDENPKRHSVGDLAESIQRYGFKDPPKYEPELNNGQGGIVEGNGRIKTLRMMQQQGQAQPRGIDIVAETGEWAIPVLFGVDAASESVARAYAISHNNLVLAGSDMNVFDTARMWDESQYVTILQDLAHADALPVGLDGDDVDALMREFLGEDDDSDVPEPKMDMAAELQEVWGTALGQVWEMPSQTVEGKAHRLMCGDSTDTDDVERLMKGERARYGIHDPPYGIGVVGAAADSGGSGRPGFGSVGSSSKVAVNLYSPVKGDDQPFDPTHLLGASDFVVLWGGNYYADKLPPMKGWIVWDKKGREGWRDTFSDCELAWTNLPIVTRIVRHTWMGMVQEGEREKRVHPTQKPAALFAKIMNDCFDDEGDVIDFYAGSGPTLVACEKTGRIGYGMEICEKYVAVSLQRLQDMGLEPRLVEP